MSVHYSDEDLLRALDGELPRLHAYAVREHLRTCWRCRDRQAELEEQIRAVVRSLHDTTPTGPAWMSAQKERLRQSQREWETTHVAEPVVRSGLRWAAGWRHAMAVAAVVAVVAAAALWSMRGGEQPPTYEPRAVLAQAVAAEALPESASVEQEFRVEYVVGEADESRAGGRLTFWADGETERFASRWSDAAGGVGHYSVRSSGREYIYGRGRGAGAFAARAAKANPVTLTAVLQHAKTTVEVESGFLAWLESRDWKPLSLTGEMARFVDASGVSLDVRRVEDEQGGGQALEIVAQRTLGEGAVARMIVELDVRSLEVRRHRLEITSLARRAVIVFTPERRERYTLARMPAAPFDVASIEQELRATAAIGRGEEATPAPSVRGVRVDREEVSAASDDGDALDLLLALHKERLCESGNVVVQQQGDRWGLTVVAPSREEALRLRSVLRPGETRRLVVRVVSADEAIGGLAAGDVAAASEQHRSEASELAIGEALRRYFAANGDPESAGEQVAALSRDGVRLSQQLLRHAEAIDRVLLLADGRADARTSRMLRDHGASLVRGARDLDALLEAPLSAVAPHDDASPAPAGTERWADLRDALWRTDQLVNVLLAGANDAESGRASEGEVSAELLKELDGVSAGAVRWLAGVEAAEGPRE